MKPEKNVRFKRTLSALLGTALLFALGACKAQIEEDDLVYFMVAERGHIDSSIPINRNDAYILPLSDQEAIRKARAIISGTAYPQIVLARIQAGPGANGHINRNPLNGNAPWSWSVIEFLGFADMTIEIYDGWPGYVEENLSEWLTQTGGTIGFWSYTVVRELNPQTLR